MRGQFAAKEALSKERSRMLDLLQSFKEGRPEAKVGIYTGADAL